MNVRGSPAGGLYKEALKDFKFVAGNAAIQFLRGPMFSNMLKGEEAKRGHFDISPWTEQQKLERLFFGGAIPSVQALNGRPKEGEQIDRAGMCAPLERAVDALAGAYREHTATLLGQPVPSHSSSARKRSLEALSPFDGSAVDAVLHGGRLPKLGFPKFVAKEGQPLPWYAQPLPEDA